MESAGGAGSVSVSVSAQNSTHALYQKALKFTMPTLKNRDQKQDLKRVGAHRILG
jgi:hypothetical protein